MRRIAAPPLALILLLVTVLPVSAAPPQRDTWDTSYSLAPAEFCGYAVDVHDYGSDSYFKVGPSDFDWSKVWHGTRDYANPANDRTASMEWTFVTVQSLESQSATVRTLLYTNHGSIRVVASTGSVIAIDAGQITVRRTEVLTDDGWVQQPDETVASNGPHTFDGTAFCDAVTSVLNPPA